MWGDVVESYYANLLAYRVSANELVLEFGNFFAGQDNRSQAEFQDFDVRVVMVPDLIEPLINLLEQAKVAEISNVASLINRRRRWIMLALNSPVIQQGFYYGGNGSVHGQTLAWPLIGSSAIIGPDSFVRTIQEIKGLNDLAAQQGEAPTAVAQQTAKTLLAEAQAYRSIYVIPSAVEASEGDVLIHWDTASKSVVLICPASTARPAQIYTEVLEGRRAVHSEMAEASARTLSDALAWVLRAK